MSHYQSKADRNEAQLKKGGRAAGSGYQRAGGQAAPGKGGGAGGPGPAGSAPPLQVSPQTFSPVPSPRAGSGPGSGNRGGKRSNGPAGSTKGHSGGGGYDHGGNYYKVVPPAFPYQQQPQGTVPPQAQPATQQQPHLQQEQRPPQEQDHQQGQQQPDAVGRQRVASPSANQPAHMSSGLQADPKLAFVGQLGALPAVEPRPNEAPILPSKAGLKVAVPSSPVAAEPPASPAPIPAASPDLTRAGLQPPFAFQFGSISPGCMQIPPRTHSAPPNLDEQKWDQARFESARTVQANKLPPVSLGQAQPISYNAARSMEPPSEQSLQPHSGQLPNSFILQQPPPQQSLNLGMVEPQQLQYSQGQNHLPPQPPVQRIPQLLPSEGLPVMQMQGQLPTVQVSQGGLPTQLFSPQGGMAQKGLVQQNMGQMKYPHSNILTGQLIPSQMTNALGGPLSPQQLQSQLVHPQLGPMPMGGQLSPGNHYPHVQFMQQRTSRAVKIVHPETHEELRFDGKGKKGEYLNSPTSGPPSPGLQGRVSSNGLPRPSLGYSNARMQPPGIAYNYYGAYSHTPQQPYYASVGAKAGVPPPPPQINSPSARFGFPGPGQGGAYVGHQPSSPLQPVSQVGHGGMSLGLAGAAPPTEVLISQAPTPVVIVPAPIAAQPSLPHIAGVKITPPDATQPPPAVVEPSAPITSKPQIMVTIPDSSATTPCSSPVVAFQFGDIESANSPVVPSSAAEQSVGHSIASTQVVALSTERESSISDEAPVTSGEPFWRPATGGRGASGGRSAGAAKQVSITVPSPKVDSPSTSVGHFSQGEKARAETPKTPGLSTPKENTRKFTKKEQRQQRLIQQQQHQANPQAPTKTTVGASSDLRPELASELSGSVNVESAPGDKPTVSSGSSGTRPGLEKTNSFHSGKSRSTQQSRLSVEAERVPPKAAAMTPPADSEAARLADVPAQPSGLEVPEQQKVLGKVEQVEKQPLPTLAKDVIAVGSADLLPVSGGWAKVSATFPPTPKEGVLAQLHDILSVELQKQTEISAVDDPKLPLPSEQAVPVLANGNTPALEKNSSIELSIEKSQEDFVGNGAAIHPVTTGLDSAEESPSPSLTPLSALQVEPSASPISDAVLTEIPEAQLSGAVSCGSDRGTKTLTDEVLDTLPLDESSQDASLRCEGSSSAFSGQQDDLLNMPAKSVAELPLDQLTASFPEGEDSVVASSGPLKESAVDVPGLDVTAVRNQVEAAPSAVENSSVEAPGDAVPAVELEHRSVVDSVGPVLLSESPTQPNSAVSVSSETGERGAKKGEADTHGVLSLVVKLDGLNVGESLDEGATLGDAAKRDIEDGRIHNGPTGHHGKTLPRSTTSRNQGEKKVARDINVASSAESEARGTQRAASSHSHTTRLSGHHVSPPRSVSGSGLDPASTLGGQDVGSLPTLSEQKPGSKKTKKKMKELLAKADAAGTTADLFTAYKATEEKKADEVKRTDAGSGLSADTRKDAPALKKPVPKDLDDWEDAAELATPRSTAAVPPVTNTSLDESGGTIKYTRDFLLTFKDLHRDLPPHFEIKPDIVELLLNPQAIGAGLVDREALPSPGRGLERQLSSGPRLERRPSMGSTTDEDRWSKQSGPAAGRGHLDGGMQGGGFWPGQGVSNAGLIARLPSGIRPGMAPGIMMGLIPGGGGGPLLPHMMVGGGVRPNGVDADRWQRAPTAGKGLMPSPRTSLPKIHHSDNPYEVGKVSDEEQAKQRQIKGILNKLTPQNFDKLFAQVKDVNIDSASTLTGVISQIFDKALMEPTFCEMYAKFCVTLAVELPEFTEENEKITFKRVLLNKCQEEFERGEQEEKEAEIVEEEGEVQLSKEEREEKRLKARRRMLGNIRFIGELYKKSMLTERIMHECILKLLGGYQNPDEEDVEALCNLMSTIGRIIDHQKAKEHIDAYFQRMETLSNNMKLSSRLRFMLKDVIDLRGNGWQERRKVEGPKRIDEVHRDAVQERQAQAQSGRTRGSSMGAPRGRIVPPPDYSRAPPHFGPQTGSASPVGGARGGMRGFGQDVRVEDRLMMEARPVPMPLSTKLADEGPITLGPQGGLGRGIGVRGQPLAPGRSALADVPAAMLSDRRHGGLPGSLGYGLGSVDRGHFVGREDMSTRPSGLERSLSNLSDKPLLERQPGLKDNYAADRWTDASHGSALSANALVRPATPSDRASSTVSTQLSEEDLKKKSESTIQEFYSVRDKKEVALCVEDLKSPQFHPTMISLWVSESLDRKDVDRNLLVTLLVYLWNAEPPVVTTEQVVKGFEMVISLLEETMVDVPRAPAYLGTILGKLIAAGTISVQHVAKLFRQEQESGELLESSVVLNMFLDVLDVVRAEKSESAMCEIYRASGLHIEDFFSVEDRAKGEKIEVLLQKKQLQCLCPMIVIERHIKDALQRDEPPSEILTWIQKDVPQALQSEVAFLQTMMTEVLRHCVPSAPSQNDKLLKQKLRRYAPLLKKFASGKAAEANQRQYIVAVQLHANELGHPPGLMSFLFDSFYRDEVISEGAYIKWQDDVKDTTPGRDKAIREVGKWLAWLAAAEEEESED